jgi:stringent starvation protein B
VSEAPSTKPYLIRAIHEWCSDNGFRPYIAVAVDAGTQVPMEFVRGGEIVLNVSAEATHHLVIGNDRIEFEARFNRVARQVSVPIANVSAIYAAENGHGMAFEVPKPPAISEAAPPTPGAPDANPTASPADAVSSPPAPVPKRRPRARKADADAEAGAAAVAPMTLVPIPAAPATAAAPSAGGDANPAGSVPPSPPPAPAPGGRPRLTRVK